MNNQGPNWGPNWGPNRALNDSYSVTTEELPSLFTSNSSVVRALVVHHSLLIRSSVTTHVLCTLL